MSIFRGEYQVDEYLDSGRLKQEGLFNAPFVEQLVAEHMSGSRDREAVLWALIFLADVEKRAQRELRRYCVNGVSTR